MERLHVTNGDVAADLLRRSGLGGTVLPWRDVLHEGPVPQHASLAELRQRRARFIADAYGDPPFQELLRQFRERDALLESAERFDEITLWFEHDLFDQLQLIQVLHRLAGRHSSRPDVAIICVDRHPRVERFVGLGQLQPADLTRLHAGRRPATPAQLDLARRAWLAFCRSSPTELLALYDDDCSALPFLRAALRRLFEQYPAATDGLSRSERAVLRCAADGPISVTEAFRTTQDDEEAPFMGDTTFVRHVDELCRVPPGLLGWCDDDAGRTPPAATWNRERRLRIAEPGRRVLAGEVDRVELGGFERWLGGVHLQGPHPAWRFDLRRRTLVETHRPTG